MGHYDYLDEAVTAKTVRADIDYNVDYLKRLTKRMDEYEEDLSNVKNLSSRELIVTGMNDLMRDAEKVKVQREELDSMLNSIRMGHKVKYSVYMRRKGWNWR
jgi:predicted DNA-binding protein YlxM (UPF0122 family)